MVWNKLIYDNLTACALLCDESATNFSQATDLDSWHRLIFLSLDCADICRQVGMLYVRGSENTRLIAHACIDVCQKCIDEANRFNNSRCTQISVLCHQTIDSCGRLISMDGADMSSELPKTPTSLFYGINLRDSLYN